MASYMHGAAAGGRRGRKTAGPVDPYRIVFVTGALLLVLMVFMVPPMLVDMLRNNSDWEVFAGSALVTGFAGLMMVLVSRDAWSERVRLKEGFLLTVTSWLVLSLFASIPYLFLEDPGMSFPDAWFETVSGLTTTGSTVLSGLDTLPPGILLWRSLTQWIGGVGIVVMALIMLPFLKVGGMQLFQTESSDRSDKIVPQARQFIAFIAMTYIALTAACALAYKLAGMGTFDALNHAMTTLATGGFSTHDASMGHFGNPAIHWLAALFMFAGSLPMVLYVRAAREWKLSIFRDPQVGGLIRILLFIITLMTLWRIFATGREPLDALREVTFNVMAVISTTGFALGDFTTWGMLAVMAFFAMMFIGGCTGSTAGGLKIFRLQVMVMATQAYLKRLASPHRVVSISYAGRPVTSEIAMSVFAFVSVLSASVLIFAVLIALSGVEFTTALSAAVTAVTNVGPGIGPVIGPAGNFAPLPDAAKILLGFAMLLGRLEFFTVLVVLSPQFWK